jgi:hypothetical protein
MSGWRSLRGERKDSRSRTTERPPETPDEGEVSVKTNATQAARAERRQPVLVLQSAELALDGGAATRKPLLQSRRGASNSQRTP